VENYKTEINNLIIEIDYYTELLGAIASISENKYVMYDLGRELNNRVYHRSLRQYFDRVKMLDAVKMLENFSEEYYFYNKAVIRFFLMLSNDVYIDRLDVCKYSEEIEEDLFNHFLGEINKFIRGSNYDSFYKRNKNLYSKVIEQFSKDYRIYDPINYICKMLNIDDKRKIHINLLLGVTNNNYRIDFDDKIYLCLRPVKESNKNRYPYFTYNPVEWTTLMINKYIEQYIIDILEKYLFEIGQVDISMYKKILNDFYGEDDIITYVKETIVKAIECVYISRVFTDYVDDFIEKSNKEGYYKIREIYKLLKSEEIIDLNEYIMDMIKIF